MPSAFPSRPATLASTEPRSFERGDAEELGADGIKVFLLQRSRALSSAEIRLRHRVGLGDNLASTEPRSFERGDPAEWSHPPGPRPASTEPRSFERGDLLTPPPV